MDLIEGIDLGVWNFIQAQRRPIVDIVMLRLSILGNPIFLGALTIQAVLELLVFRWIVPACLVLLAAIGAPLLVQGMHTIIVRDPPQVIFKPLEPNSSASSFPDEQTFTSTVVYLMLAVVLAESLTSPRQRFWIIRAGMWLAFLAGVSRMYIGKCYPTDVIGGWLGGAAWALGWGYLLQRIPHDPKKSPIQ